MCGITGIYAFNDGSSQRLDRIRSATGAIKHRGLDGEGVFNDERVALGHRRLSILDLSDKAAQPMQDPSENFVIVFNGEIFNYRTLKSQYFDTDYPWRSDSDTELLLALYKKFGVDCLSMLHGFFAFAIYNRHEQSILLARDRFGKKPLYYSHEPGEYFVFASELDSLMKFGIPRELDPVSVSQYFHFNYIPESASVLKNVKKLPAGFFLMLSMDKLEELSFYRLPHQKESVSSYSQSQRKLIELLDRSVQDRMISDVPVGAFLSGGVDSSVVVALASRHTQHLKTFSIGYSDNPYFDETHYAELVARKFNTEHTVFKLSTSDIEAEIDHVLNSFSEPFADSSAIPLYILAKQTRQHVTVALSGDGGDEIFAGYNKHKAEFSIRRNAGLRGLANLFEPFARALPASRNSPLSNRVRQARKYLGGLLLSPKERYWSWAGIMEDEEALHLCRLTADNIDEYNRRKVEILHTYESVDTLQDYLRTDIGLVLQSDMLVKVDRMSMANGLEVRSPFLDHRVVEFAMGLPDKYKVQGRMGKRIVQDALRNLLPAEIYNRPKKGFEVPLLDWFRGSWRSRIDNEYLAEDFIKEQGLFDLAAISRIKGKLFSNDPGDSVATVWALIVFQHWWKRYLSGN